VRFRCSYLPSTEYKADIVCIEYQVGALVFSRVPSAALSREVTASRTLFTLQVGYKMGEKCIRPAMVVVSTGPGPA